MLGLFHAPASSLAHGLAKTGVLRLTCIPACLVWRRAQDSGVYAEPL